MYSLNEMMAAHEPIAIHLSNDADANGETIAPSIILPFIENAFRQVYIQPLPERHVNIHIRLQQSVLSIHICWNKPIDTSTLAQGRISLYKILREGCNSFIRKVMN